MHASCILVVAAILCVSLMQASSFNADRIDSLPGQPTPNNSFSQFSGYITVDDEQKTAFFYYFVEAESNPETKPLVLWLNGGPGCSSLGYGAFGENGPFRTAGKVLIRNEYSWNKEANMLYLESPAGVGFSYSESFNVSANDKTTAQYNLKFLEIWLIRYPVYKNRDLFLMGESYAGHYVPQLAQLIVNQSASIRSNLKAIAIGNPLLNADVDFESVGVFLWFHGVLSDSTYELLKTNCSYARMYREYYETGDYSKECKDVLNITAYETGFYMDLYNVLSDVCLSDVSQFSSLHHPMMTMMRTRYQSLSPLYHSQLQDNQQNAPDVVDVCLDDKTTNYLNRKDVQKALHARLVGVENWSLCSMTLKYDMKDLEISVIEVLGSIVNEGIQVLVYSGDQDSDIPFIGTRTNVASLATDLKLNTSVNYRAWLDGDQVGGWTQAYGGNLLSFATVRGAGHEVPLFSPRRALTLFRAFISGEPLPSE